MQSTRPSDTSPALVSMPVYRSHVLQEEASHHVLVFCCPPSEEDRALAGRLADEVHDRSSLLTAGGCGGQELLCKALEDVLKTAHSGTHLYVSGTEQQVWRVYNVARACGLHPDEISIQRNSTSLSPVYCVHCSTLQETADAGETTCTTCGVRLVIREHFSRLLGAYMGVVANADRPYAESRP